MLEPIREYAAEHLADSEEADEVSRRHARYYASLVAARARALRRYDPAAHAFVRSEAANLRVGLASALTDGDSRAGALYLYGLWFHWLRNRTRSGRCDGDA